MPGFSWPARDEAQWADAFARSQDALAKLADETLAEFVAGDTEILDLDDLVSSHTTRDFWTCLSHLDMDFPSSDVL